jgi:hypothetical protein
MRAYSGHDGCSLKRVDRCSVGSKVLLDNGQGEEIWWHSEAQNGCGSGRASEMLPQWWSAIGGWQALTMYLCIIEWYLQFAVLMKS